MKHKTLKSWFKMSLRQNFDIESDVISFILGIGNCYKN